MSYNQTVGGVWDANLKPIGDKPENQECADCTAPTPTWASWSLGVFLCEKCCGAHRQLGTHISQTRSCYSHGP